MLLRGGSIVRQIRGELRFVPATTVVLLALAPIVVVMAARSLWLVPVAAIPLVGIQLGSRRALINEAHARIDALTGAVPSWVASCSPWRGGSSATRSAAV